jgi:hypothetical protein
MVVSLVLPWMDQFFTSMSYLSALFEMIRALTTVPEVLKSLTGKDVLMLLGFAGPAIAALVAGGAAIAALDETASPGRTGGALATGGGLGLLATGGLYLTLRDAQPLGGMHFGMGYFLFALAALVLTVAGNVVSAKDSGQS